MKRGEVLLAMLGLVLSGAGCFFIVRSRDPMRDIVLADGCRVPIRVVEPSSPNPAAAAIVFHGLSANRRLMQTVGQQIAAAGLRVYLVDLPGHGDNTQPFSYARAEDCAAFTVAALARRGAVVPADTVLVGHSMGGAIAVRLADHVPTAATIAISPAPLLLPRRMPANLLVFSAQFDLPQLQQTSRKLLEAAGGERTEAEDFRQRRAVQLTSVPRATHTSLIFDPRVGEQMDRWIGVALPHRGRSPAGFSARGLAGSGAGLLGLLLMFPLVTGGLSAAFRARGSEPLGCWPAAGDALLRWVVAALFAVGVLNFFVPLRALRIYSGAYLASFLLLAGTILLALVRKDAQRALRFRPRAVTMACALGLVTVLGFGAWLNWEMTDAWLNAARWLRFAFLLPVCLPYFAAEETALGPLAERRNGARFSLFLLLRLVVWLAQVFALFVLASGPILVFLLGLYLAAFSVVQRLGADAVRRRTGSATAAAVFDAILGAWFIAAVFPLT